MRPAEFPSILHDSRSLWIVLNGYYLIYQLSINLFVLISGIHSWVSEKTKKKKKTKSFPRTTNPACSQIY